MAIDHPQTAPAASKRGEEIYEFEDVGSRGSCGNSPGSFGHTSWRSECPGQTAGGSAKPRADAATSSAQPAHGTATAAACGAGSRSANIHHRGVECRQYRCVSARSGRRLAYKSEERKL